MCSVGLDPDDVDHLHGSFIGQLQLEAILCFRTYQNETENLFCEIGCMPHSQGIQVVNIAFGVRLDF